MIQVTASVISNIEVMPATHLVWLESPRTAATARPGQFVMVRCGQDTLLRRPLSVHQVEESKIALLFSIVGKGTRWLAQRQSGDSLDIFGPLGNGFTISHGSKKLLLISGGMGIAPMQFMEDRAISDGYLVQHLKGAATASQLFKVMSNMFKQYGTFLTAQPAAAAQYNPPSTVQTASTTEDGSAGIKGMITILIPNYIKWADQIFACGPMGMYRSMAQMPQLKDKSVQVSLEIMMGCGAGVCYGCTIKTKNGLKQVCQDGPVFDLADLTNINWMS